jgi:NADPH-dependent glutamate synthase beta subunit-like oxidoreductase
LVIGLGPAGIANALEMAKDGYAVDAIDANSDLGGALENLIPEFRFDKTLLQGIKQKFAKLEIRPLYNKRVGVDLFLTDLLPLYDSIFVACGSDLPQFSDLEGENLPVYYAHDLLNRSRYSPAQIAEKIGKNVVIIGLGNVAIDMARVLIRLHKTVTIVYRRTQAEAPAGKKEVAEALKEGIRILDLSLPTRWISENGTRRLLCVKTKVITNELNQACVVNCEGEEFSLDTDDLIFATGQKSSDDVFNGTDIRLKSGSSPYATSNPKVFVGGDRINHHKRIVDAMVSGIEVASLIKGAKR